MTDFEYQQHRIRQWIMRQRRVNLLSDAGRTQNNPETSERYACSFSRTTVSVWTPLALSIQSAERQSK